MRRKEGDADMKRNIKLLACIAGVVMFFVIGSLPIFSLEVEAASEIELLQTAISHLKEDVNVLEEEIEALKNNPAADGVGISKIEQTATSGNEDTYTITLTNGETYDFVIKNGQNGRDGKDGVGISKIEQTAASGNADTYTIILTNGTTYDLVIKNGQKGQNGQNGRNGKDGIDGKDGRDGKDGVGISKIEQTASEGNKNTYTITLTDGNAYDFIVENGLDGKDGENTIPQVVKNEDANFDSGTIGMIIASISLLGNVIMSIYLFKKRGFKKN